MNPIVASTGFVSKVATGRAAWLAILAICLAAQAFGTTSSLSIAPPSAPAPPTNPLPPPPPPPPPPSTPQVPCFFIFGDSLNDNGNNNDLLTQAKANYPPYGVDGPAGVELGRFTNGQNVPDVLSGLMGFQNFIKPYRTVTGSEILQGVNYASGASGIRDESGSAMGGRYPLDQQVLHHKIIVARTILLLGGSQAATARLKKCIYYINTGSNDYINNYFMPSKYTTSRFYTPDQYAADLIQRYSDQLKILYTLGARKIAVVTLGQLGFTPVELTTLAGNSLALNAAAELFNNRLKPLVDSLNQIFPDAKFTYLDTNVVSSTPNNIPTAFTNATGPCCELGSTFQCEPYDLNICADRTKYVYFDNIHPTEAVNVFLGNGYYFASTTSSPPGAHPYNIQQLAQAP